MRYSIALFMLLCLCSCQSFSKSKLAGAYDAYQYKYIEYNRALITEKLYLNTDSTFRSTFCNGCWKGTWSVAGDSILLYHKTFTYFDSKGKDSVSVKEPSSIPKKLGITRKGHLHKAVVFKSNEKRRTANLCYRKKEH
ncbi:hypothetical protein [Edaphocola aurantiacus]|uniref:hypothetical protein n=1 Tax=Edaphocola aurantiacus TaxID=2601682 RepID=UPI001C97620D|nr:hypothetical protein [Edaphocola aurantiacus]